MELGLGVGVGVRDRVAPARKPAVILFFPSRNPALLSLALRDLELLD